LVVAWTIIDSGAGMSLAEMGFTRRRGTWRWTTRSLALAVALMTSAVAAHAASDLAVRGSAIAAEKCGRCHAVGVADDSPHKITPPLRELAQDYPIAMLVDALKTGVVGGHDEMPQFDLGVDEAKALVAYIDSLDPNGPQYLGKAP
jgi:mono/diheme cytochrome c family protein